jgi:TPP-dependent pyruvate/acetoin dehydrogenase alpha subunit
MSPRERAHGAKARLALAPAVREDPALTDDDRLALMRAMVLMREVEEAGNRLYRQGKIPGSFYDGRGQEAISVGATFALAPNDPVCSPLIRDLGAHLVRGTDLADLFRHYMGRSNPISRGREGNVHFGDRRLGIVGMVSMLPDMMVVATGLAMAFAMRGERRCALSFFGDGATSRGDWHEAMNSAALDRLPVVFVLEDNQLAYSTPHDRQFAVHPTARAAGYGVPADTIDGNDVEAVFAATCAARERALDGEGPTLICATTMRMHGHGAHDDARYVDPALTEEWQTRDPIQRYERVLLERDLEVGGLREDVRDEVAVAIEAALATPMADPADVLDGIFCDGDPEPLGTGGAPTWSGLGSAGT